MKNIEEIVDQLIQFFVRFVRLLLLSFVPWRLINRLKNHPEDYNNPFTFLGITLFVTVRAWQYVALSSFSTVIPKSEEFSSDQGTLLELEKVLVDDFISLPSLTEFLLIIVPLLVILYYYSAILKFFYRKLKLEINVPINTAIIYLSGIYFFFITLNVITFNYFFTYDNEYELLEATSQSQRIIALMLVGYFFIYLSLNTSKSHRKRTKTILVNLTVLILTLGLLSKYTQQSAVFYLNQETVSHKIEAIRPTQMFTMKLLTSKEMSQDSVQMTLMLHYHERTSEKLVIQSEELGVISDYDSKNVVGKFKFSNSDIILHPNDTRILDITVLKDSTSSEISLEQVYLVNFQVISVDNMRHKNVVSPLNLIIDDNELKQKFKKRIEEIFILPLI